MAAIVPTGRGQMQKLELEYAKTVLAALQKIEATLRKKLIELATLEARRVELEIALLEQTKVQAEEFRAITKKVAAMDGKCKAMRNPNAYCNSEVMLEKWTGEYFTSLSSDLEFCKFHPHRIDLKGAENAYHKNWSSTTWDALTLPAGCGSIPKSLGEIQ